MPFDATKEIKPCTVCGSGSNWLDQEFNIGQLVDCNRCGDFQISHVVAREHGLPLREPKLGALASHLIRKMSREHRRPILRPDFFEALPHQRLPTPAQICDNLIKWFAVQGDFRPGPLIECIRRDEAVCAEIGAVGYSDLGWALKNIQTQGLLQETGSDLHRFRGNLTGGGWERYEELQRAHIASNYAFFARKFGNEELDMVVERCLRPAIEQTGFELRTVTQRAGLIDAIIEDEIRRCKFLIADLSDDNAGAYWEAGFAEGLGKPVVYICREKTTEGKDKKTHFDTDHRHTVRWNASSLDATARQLKAVIRNTLLSEAKQDD